MKKLQSNPVCERCEEDGRCIMATEVHHVIPVESASGEPRMRELMYRYSNLQSLCHECHAELHKQMCSHSKEAVKANNARMTQTFIEKYLK